MKKILVVNINWLGDAVFSTPVFKALKSHYPQAKITCLCVPRVKKVLEYCPFIDSFIIMDEKKQHFWPWDKWALIKQIKSESFDIAFLLHRSFTRGLLTFLARIPIRVGFSKVKWILTHPIPFEDSDTHRSDVYLKVVEGYGLKVKDRTCQLNINPDDVEQLNKILTNKGIGHDERFIVLHTSGNWFLKRWPQVSFARLIEKIHHRLKLKVILSGSHSDLSVCESINQLAGNLAIVLAGETNLGQSLALFCRAEVLVSSDSGPLHLSQAVGGNAIGLFGPTRPDITGPRGMGKVEILFHEIGCNKAPCYHLSCTNNICMQSISEEDVLKTIQKFIN